MLSHFSTGGLFSLDRSVLSSRNFPTLTFSPVCFSIKHLGPVYCLPTQRGYKYFCEHGPVPFFTDGRVYHTVAKTKEQFEEFKAKVMAMNAYEKGTLPEPTETDYSRYHSCGIN